MALTDEGNGGIPATMLVGPANIGGSAMPYPYPMMMGGGQGGFGNGQDGWWIVLLIILLAAGSWGNNGNNGGGAFGGGQPIIINDSQSNGGAVQRGFDQAAVMSGINGIQSGVQSLSTQLCGCCCDMQNTVNQGFFGTQNALNAGFNNAETAANARQMADMQQAFAAQTAMSQGFNGLQAQLAQCCCDNRLATESLRATVLSENCEDRYQAANNTRDIIENATRNNQAILDKLCQLELDAKNDRINDLERQLTMANLAASQTAQTARLLDNNNAQTARLLADNTAQTVALEQYLNPTPIPAYIVQNPNCCQQNSCGCGCGGNF